MLKVQTMGTNKEPGKKGLKSLDLPMGKGGAEEQDDYWAASRAYLDLSPLLSCFQSILHNNDTLLTFSKKHIHHAIPIWICWIKFMHHCLTFQAIGIPNSSYCAVFVNLPTSKHMGHFLNRPCQILQLSSCYSSYRQLEVHFKSF